MRSEYSRTIKMLEFFSLRKSYIIRPRKTVKMHKKLLLDSFVQLKSQRRDISAIVFLRTQREYWIWFPFFGIEKNVRQKKQFYRLYFSRGLLYWNKRWDTMGGLTFSSIEDCNISLDNVRIGKFSRCILFAFIRIEIKNLRFDFWLRLEDILWLVKIDFEV